MQSRPTMKICNKDMQRRYVRQHVFLAGWGSFETSTFLISSVFLFFPIVFLWLVLADATSCRVKEIKSIPVKNLFRAEIFF